MARKGIRSTVVTLGSSRIPAQEYAITQKEFFEASGYGFKPQSMFKIRAAAYSGEDRLTTVSGQVLAIYRVYTVGDWIELYTERRAGVS